MGCFSWTCAVCTHDILGDAVPGYKDYNAAKVLLPNGDILTGDYDSYGGIAGLSLVDHVDDFKLVHLPCWKRGMTYETLGETKHAQNQGFWPGERAAEGYWGPPKLEEIEYERKYVCFECRRTWKSKWSGGRCTFGCAGPRPCKEHNVSTIESAEQAGSAFYKLERLWRNDACKQLMEQGLSQDDAWNELHSASPPEGLLKDKPKGCDACRDFLHKDTVEGFGYHNAVGICRNTAYQFQGEGKPGNCYYYGSHQLLEHGPEDGPTICRGCDSSDHLELVKLLESPLEQLAAEA